MISKEYLPYLKGSIFIVTYGRSGSTLLMNVINTIKGAEIKGENYNALFPLFQSIMKAQLTSNHHGNDSAKLSSPWLGANNINHEQYKAELIVTFVKNILRPSLEARFIGFKEIRYSSHPSYFIDYLDFIQNSFPNAKLVFNMRNPEDTSQSGWYKEQDRKAVIDDLNWQISVFQNYLDKHPNDTISVSYDEYNGNPNALRKMFGFLEEPFNEEEIASVMSKRLSHLKEVEN